MPSPARGTPSQQVSGAALLDLGLRFEDGPGYLHIHLEGPYEFTRMLGLVDTIAGEITLRDARRAIVDVREVTGDIPDFDRYELASATARALARVERFAMVEQAARINHFFEDTAVNRGMRMRVFEDAEEAARWVLGQDIQPK